MEENPSIRPLTRIRILAPRLRRLSAILVLGLAPAHAQSELPSFVYFFNHVHSSRSQDNPGLGSRKKGAPEIRRVALRHLEELGHKGVLAITDHNDDASFDDLSSQRGAPGRAEDRLQALRSAEWGIRTHLGLVGLPPRWEKLARFKDYEFERQVAEAAPTGALRIINHPDYGGREWPWKRWDEAEAVEVFNGVVEHVRLGLFKRAVKKSNNGRAIEQWDRALRAGRRYTAVAGSDFHIHVPFTGMTKFMLYPANLVFSESNDPAAVIAAIRAGRVSLQALPDAPRIHLRARWECAEGAWVEMGGTLKGKGNLVVEVLADRARGFKGAPAEHCVRTGGLLADSPGAGGNDESEGPRANLELQLFTGAGAQMAPVKSAGLDPACPWARWRVALPSEGAGSFVRAEVRAMGSKRLPVALSNPVYILPL